MIFTQNEVLEEQPAAVVSVTVTIPSPGAPQPMLQILPDGEMETDPVAVQV